MLNNIITKIKNAFMKKNNTLEEEKSTNTNNIKATDLFKEDKDTYTVEQNCVTCPLNELCNGNIKEHSYLCKFSDEVLQFKDIDTTKTGIIILDDNSGVISFLEDDLTELDEDGIIDMNNYNLLKFTSQYAVFILQAALMIYKDLNIKLALFDLTLGGGVYDDTEGNIILDGVDAFISAKSAYPNMNYLFFTGNKLNPYINKNQMIMKKFNDFTNDNIKNHILYKTQLSQEERKEYIVELLNNIK